MRRYHLFFVVLIALTFALHGCGEGSESIDAGEDKDASGSDSGTKDPGDGDDLCADVNCPDDGNVCTMNRCNPASGECETIGLSHVPCDDGVHCNGAEVCVEGVCESSGDPCGGAFACNEEHDTCGCNVVDDCAPLEWGAWGACECDTSANSCNFSGSQSRQRATMSCDDGLCIASGPIETDMRNCNCGNTNGSECTVSGTVAPDACDWGECEAGECQVHTCAGATNVCDNDEQTCVQCLTNAHCSSSGGQVRACKLNVCETVECTESSHCGSDEGCCLTGTYLYTCRPTGSSCFDLGPTVVNPTVVNPTVINPTVINPTIINPTIINPTFTNPAGP